MTGPDSDDLPTNESLNRMRRERRRAARKARRLPRRIERRVRAARAMLVWESLWPALWPAVGLTGFFISLALFGVFTGLPMGLHWALLAGFGSLLALAIWKGLRSFRWPDRTAALRHLEKASGLTHQPLEAYEDMPAEGTGDRILWIAHQRWVGERLKKLKTGIASPGLAAIDPYGLRAAVALLLVIGLAGTESGQLHRIAGAFLPGAGAGKAFTVEAWITPPSYTGVAPIYLEGQGNAANATPKSGMDETPLKVPVGSILSLRVHGLRTAPALEAGSGDRGRPEPLKDMGEANYTLDAPIAASTEFALTQGGRLMRGWKVEAIPDQKPTIEFAKPLQQTAKGALRFAYKVHDDYGVVAAEARIALAPEAQTGAPATPGMARARPLVTPPSVNLPLPVLRPRDANGETYVDLLPHPWAGLPVTITLVATDDAGNEGLSLPVSLTLPAREFKKPLAAAIVEQRRALALDPASLPTVARVLDDLTVDGDRYIPDKTVYLTMRAVYWRLANARRDSDLTGVFDLMWQIALRIEDGDVSLAENDVRQARDALSKALAQGAGNDEIERLMAELKQAFQRYMDALAAKGAPSPSPMDKFAPQDGQTVDRDQLQKMLDAIGELARTGARDQAKAMLEQLQAIMENMQVPDQNQGMTGDEQAMAGAVDKMGKLIDKERELMDRTFKEGAKGMTGMDGLEGNPSPNGQQGGSPSALKALKHAQEALRGELEQLMRDLGKAGVKIPDALGKAQGAMQSAEERLGDGRTDRATASQGQAIDGMREGAQGLADKLMQSMAGKRGQSGRGNGNAQTDPFGRPLPNSGLDLGTDVAVPEKIDIQRAREIIEELRRRAGELGRPKIELDYLDRLLKRF